MMAADDEDRDARLSEARCLNKLAEEPYQRADELVKQAEALLPADELPSLEKPMTPESPEFTECVSILLVDPSRGDECVASLRSRFEVLEAATETAAIRSLKLSRPAALVTELGLSQGDGLAVCLEAKRQAEPPAILVTTAIAQDVPAALIAGCDGVLIKPFPPNLLHTRLARLLRGRAHVAVSCGTSTAGFLLGEPEARPP